MRPGRSAVGDHPCASVRPVRAPRSRPVRSRVPALLLFALSGALVATSAPVGAQTTGSTVPTGNPVRIGLQGPLTGSQQAYGQGMLKGAQLAAERLNAEGGILGRKVEIVPIDD
ncbi:MAG: hypothetical protein EBU70_13785, partial [Actinobacteria bacterium]|nr:hypothetical protein [Actinomycetota bacterium]